jgi:hypothetical protein
MTRHDTVKYEAESLCLAFRRLQYFAKKMEIQVRQAPLGLANLLTLAGLMIRDSHDDFIQSTRSTCRL